MNTNDHIKRAREIVDIEAQSLHKAGEGLGQEFSDAIELIIKSLDAGGKIVVSGIGKSLHIAEKLSATLASTGATSVALNPVQAMHGDMGIFSTNDILLALSYSGESEELLCIVPLAKRINVKTVAITGSVDNSLAVSSDIAIPVAIEREACPFNMAPTSSTTATLAIGDALAMVILEARGFDKEDYAKLHPGGAIGRTLLLHVADIMRKEDRLATIQEGSMVKDALIAMTKARSGSACVVNDQNELLGIFTDGDLRRHIPDKTDLLNLPVEDVMTKDPITVRDDQLAVDVLKIYEDHNIDDVIVLDKEGKLIGSVDIQDLPRLKIL